MPYNTDSGGGEGVSRETDDPVAVQPPVAEDEREVAFSFTADRDALFNAWNALANLADVAGEVSITARAKPKGEYDKSTLEYGVMEPLRELGLIDDGQDLIQARRALRETHLRSTEEKE